MIPFLIHSPLPWIWLIEQFYQHISSLANHSRFQKLAFHFPNFFFAWSMSRIHSDLSLCLSIVWFCSFLNEIFTAQNTSFNEKYLPPMVVVWDLHEGHSKDLFGSYPCLGHGWLGLRIWSAIIFPCSIWW